MSTEKKAPAGSSTKDLARTLGKKELMGIAIGQIIGRRYHVHDGRCYRHDRSFG